MFNIRHRELLNEAERAYAEFTVKMTDAKAKFRQLESQFPREVSVNSLEVVPIKMHANVCFPVFFRLQPE